jgi:hypothetical protein
VTTSSNNHEPIKAAICIREMAALCALSRQRFMQLVKAGVFPGPLYDVATKRPFYPEDLQTQCLEVRKRNIGVNGKVIMFYARRPGMTVPTPKSRKPPVKPKESDCYADILDGLPGLGLVTVTSAQVANAVGQLFPQETEGTDPGEVIRKVFLHLKGKDSRGNVGSK